MNKPTALPQDVAYRSVALTFQQRAEDGGELPAGVCGRLTGIALTYGEIDDYGTVFAPGCLAKTRAEKVAAGKVKLFADHGPFTHTHIGTVRALDDVGEAVLMTADLFDTEAGRRMKEYLAAVLSSGSDTGLSIGFRGREREWVEKDGMSVLVFKEIELREVSITPVPAVPGTDVVSVRAEAATEQATDGSMTPDESLALLRRTLRSILKALPEADARAALDEVYTRADAAGPDTPPVAAEADSTPPAADTANAEPKSDEAEGAGSTTDDAQPREATPEERAAALRASYR